MWTKQIPNEEGYYWIRDDAGNEAIIYISPVDNLSPVDNSGAANVWIWTARLTAPPWPAATEMEA